MLITNITVVAKKIKRSVTVSHMPNVKTKL